MRGWQNRLFGSLASLLFVAGCGGSATPTTIGTDDSSRSGTPAGWPRTLAITPGTGPALYLGPEPTSPAIGYVSPGVVVRLDGPIVDGRAPVTLTGGGLGARGWVPLSRLGAIMARRGRIEGTPAYVGAGDVVQIVQRNPDGSFRVQIAPWLGRSDSDRLGPFTATIPLAMVGSEPSGPDTGLNPGENRLLPAGQDVQVFDRPGGSVIATIPAADPPHTVVVLRERDGWNGVRVGVGPYLVGYIQGTLEPAEGPPRALYRRRVRPTDEDLPVRIATEEGPLHRIPEGTRIRWIDRVIGRARNPGWARELGRVGSDRVDVYVAVDDQVAIRGLVEVSDLASAPAAPPPSAASPPAEDAPQPEP